MMEREFGTEWRSNFKEFNEKPFAAASIGQVHRAKTLEGVEVAVKVQYPGVNESIDSDLNNLKKVMVYTNLVPKTMFLDKLIASTRAELKEECNYTTEAGKQEKYRFRNNFYYQSNPLYILFI